MKSAEQILILESHEIVAFSLGVVAKGILPHVAITAVRSFTKGIMLMESGLQPDLVILDIDVPGPEIHSMVPNLRRIQPGVRILVFTGNEEYATALKILNAGANGYLNKNHSVEDVKNAIQVVLSGKKYISEEIRQIISGDVSALFFKDTSPANIVLSPREKEVLALLLDGKHTKQISTQLNLKITTVSAHKARIFDKLQVGNVIELFKKIGSISKGPG